MWCPLQMRRTPPKRWHPRIEQPEVGHPFLAACKAMAPRSNSFELSRRLASVELPLAKGIPYFGDRPISGPAKKGSPILGTHPCQHPSNCGFGVRFGGLVLSRVQIHMRGTNWRTPAPPCLTCGQLPFACHVLIHGLSALELTKSTSTLTSQVHWPTLNIVVCASPQHFLSSKEGLWFTSFLYQETVEHPAEKTLVRGR